MAQAPSVSDACATGAAAAIARRVTQAQTMLHRTQDPIAIDVFPQSPAGIGELLLSSPAPAHGGGGFQAPLLLSTAGGDVAAVAGTWGTR
jgi:hypothetical protein